MRASGIPGGKEACQDNSAKNSLSRGNHSVGRGKLAVVGIGPGSLELITPRARSAIERAEVIIGYNTYLEQIEELIRHQEVHRLPMRKEMERCRLAVEMSLAGKKVAVISGGDPGIYGMAGPILEILGERELAVVIIPGVTAAAAAAAALGSPLMNDFAVISLSDLLTPWPVIERRLQACAVGDIVTVLYNPQSKKRRGQIVKAVQVFLKHRQETTPVGLVRNSERPTEEVILTSLKKMLEHPIDMFTTVIIGNSQTFTKGRYMVTPRGYRLG
jgi:precorrin-3B C17-methyltransferase